MRPGFINSFQPARDPALTPVVTGGTTYDYNDGVTVFRVHLFATSGSLVVVQPPTNALVVLVGGGGGGGASAPLNNAGGGGGGSGVVRQSAITLVAGTYGITVGGGGVGSDVVDFTTQQRGQTGGASTLVAPDMTPLLTATGGLGGFSPLRFVSTERAGGENADFVGGSSGPGGGAGGAGNGGINFAGNSGAGGAAVVIGWGSQLASVARGGGGGSNAGSGRGLPNGGLFNTTGFPGVNFGDGGGGSGGGGAIVPPASGGLGGSGASGVVAIRYPIGVV